MPSLFNPELIQVLEEDRAWLTKTELPIITVAGMFREDLKRAHGLPNENTSTDLVLSRAHFSMAIGALIEAWGVQPMPTNQSTSFTIPYHKAWLADPTNYVTKMQLKQIKFTEDVGKILARQKLLKKIKDLIDQFGRSKLPIVKDITPPLLYLTEKIERPIISFHITAGNILGQTGKKVLQVVTDPHVRLEYTTYAGQSNMRYCVFDERTKLDFLEQCSIHHIQVDPNRIIVTGPPVGPRTRASRNKKVAWRNGPLNLCITTGGLGTNKTEIRQMLRKLLPHLHQHPCPYRLVVYAGTQNDIAEMVKSLAKENHVRIGNLDDKNAHLRLIYHPQLFDANELLIKYGFPWAHGFITKPSGDMAYDAVAAGCFVLTLEEWGPWEVRIRQIFEQKEISRCAETDHIDDQLQVLMSAKNGQSWIEKAMNRSFGIEKLFLMGNQKIIQAAKDWNKELSLL